MKITKYFLSLAAAAGMIAGCAKPELVEIAAPDNVVAPVLEEIGDITVTKDNLKTDEVTFTWTDADFGAPTQINYAIEVAVAGGSKSVLTSGLSENTLVMSYETLNAFMLSDLNLASGKSANVEFFVSAKVGEYAKVYSNAVASAVVPVDVVIPESDLFGHIWVIGDYCGWNHANTQFLYDYSKDSNTYTGVVDFGEKAANGFKLTGGPDWNTGNWGTLDGAVLEDEQKEIQLRDDGGSGNITCFSKRFYNLEFDKSALVLKVKNAFDQLGVIGDFNGWGGDVVMEYNPVLVRFYADVEIPADGGLKVRVDADWATSWGKDMGGDNLSVAAGNYRVYLDLNKGSLIVDAKMYGKPEPGVAAGGTEPEPEPVSYVVRGNFTQWGDGEPVEMTNSGDLWTAKKVALAAIDEFKVVPSEGGWMGGPEKNADSQIDPEGDPYKVYKPELGVAFETGDENIAVGAAGEYNIVYDAANNTITVSAAPLIEGWAIAGDPTGWADGADIVMTQNGVVWSVKEVALKATEGWKLRKDGDWAKGDFGGSDEAPIAIGTAVKLSAGGKNMKVEADGTFDIYFNEVLATLFVLETGADAPAFEDIYYLVGAHNGWADAFNKIENAMIKGSEYYELKNLALAGDTDLKFSTEGWGKQLIAKTFAADSELELIDAGPNNMKVTAGTYDVYMSLDLTKVYFMTEGKTPDDAGEAPEPEEPTVPENMYMTSAEFGNWFANADEVVSLVPVNGKPGQFWTIRYLSAAGDGYKFNSSIGWDGNEFAGLTTNDGYTVDSNAKVAEDGLYMIHIDVEREMVHFEKAQVYGMGDCFGGWTEGMEAALFATDGKTVKATLAADGDIRIYAASSIANSDWWSREFIFFDGKIAYRGNGGDQDRVKGTAGQVVTLDFNAGTATLQ